MDLIKSKKGQVHNYLGVILFLMFFGFFNIIAYTVWIEFVSIISATDFATSTVMTTINNFTNGFQALDFVIIILLVIFIIGTGVLSFRLKTNTAFFIVTFIMGIFWGFVSYFFNYVFIQMVSPPVFNTALGFFPRTILLCTNLHWVMLILIVVGSITLYGKKPQQEFLQ